MDQRGRLDRKRAERGQREREQRAGLREGQRERAREREPFGVGLVLFL